MKKISILLIVLAVSLTACKKEVQNYVKISGTLTSDTEEISIKGRDFEKNIKVENGSFSDTLTVKSDFYLLSTPTGERVSIFLKNGYDLTINQTGETLNDGLEYKGEGEDSNNYFSNLVGFFGGEMGDPKEYFKLDEAAYKAKLEAAKAKINSFDKVDVDSMVIDIAERNNKQFFGFVESSYEREHANLVKFATGKDSPVFNNYENFKGGKTSLSDLKGKYVYIDVWATWCGPCLREIPYLKTLEEEMHGKNIEFVSISVDNIDGKRGSHTAWKEKVKKDNLGGIQLFADKDFRSDFIMAYGINSIPRFILIDPQGKIVDANAKRPSNPALKQQLKDLGL